MPPVTKHSFPHLYLIAHKNKMFSVEESDPSGDNRGQGEPRRVGKRLNGLVLPIILHLFIFPLARRQLGLAPTCRDP